MTKQEKELLKKKLEENKKKTEIRIKDLEELTKPISPENSIGRISRMDAINNKSVNEATLGVARKKYADIEIALDKIENDNKYGICVRCEKDIPLGRLVIMPSSKSCVRCAD